MTKLLAIRREYGEPFQSVVRSFASMGYSKRAVCSILEYNRGTFKSECDRFDLNKYFRKQADMRTECKPHGKGWVKGRKRNRMPKYSDEYLLSLLSKHGDLTYNTFSNLAPVSASIIAKRFGSWNNARRLALQCK